MWISTVFATGHLDPGETEIQAALRETQEEAGLTESQMNVYQKFKHEMNYTAFGRPKSVVYWLSEVKDPAVEVKISHEHKDWKWFNINDALGIAKYDDMKQALTLADEFIKAQLWHLHYILLCDKIACKNNH